MGLGERRILYQLFSLIIFATDWNVPYGLRGGAGHALQTGAFDSEGPRASVWTMPQTALPYCAKGGKKTTDK